MISKVIFAVFLTVLLPCQCQREPSLPINLNSFSHFLRLVPSGRAVNIRDVYIRFYGMKNVTKSSIFRMSDISRLVDDPHFDMQKPTVLYTHGYIELETDKSVQTIVRSYLRNEGYNILVLDWSNLAFRDYVTAAVDVALLGKETARAMSRLLKQGVPLNSIHLVGHSLGGHIMAYAARFLAARGLKIPRLTVLDPAYPGFYPSILGQPVSKTDAVFVDVIHSDGGGYGGPGKTGHADFWPNGGTAKQPGCLSATLLLTIEDFCSHRRSLEFWAESVAGGDFFARRCDSYDSFLRGQCQAAPLVHMGLKADPSLRGNFYLRTAAKSPFTLGVAGAS